MKKKNCKIGSLACALLAGLLLATACTEGSGSTETEANTQAHTEEVTEADTPEDTESECEQETQGDTNGDTSSDTEASTDPTDEPDDPATVEVAEREIISFDDNIRISEDGGSATVSANEGLSYTATGYQSVKDNRFVISSGFTVTLKESDVTSADFNRFSICYVSTQPIKGTVTYSENGASKTDSFFLEVGEDTFSCVTTSYLDGIKGKNITSMTFETCNGADGEFALCLLKTYDYPVYTNADQETYYISNDRYKLGIRLSWGGGINYIRDKKEAPRSLTNLINQADTGRLVQQSYYGTKGEGSYQPGVYNGSPWRYNPVQGGDMNQNHSRIIDIVVTEHSVYVKAQPQDWSLDNQITPSYMENTYTLYEDHIRVDNRFVDFSGMDHPFYHQELPAFYTVSYLGRFTWYDGSEGWSDDTLSYRDDLGFWGDSKYYDDCTFLIKESNTETWCAWTNAEEDFGIGLYVPNADSYLAGRHAYNGSPNSSDGACNYVAPVNTKQLVSYVPLEYSYLITTGSVEEIRATFKENKDFADNTSLHENYQSRRVPDVKTNSATLDFSTAARISVLNATGNSSVEYASSQGAAKLTATGPDTHVSVNYASVGAFSADEYTTLVIEYMIPTSNSANAYNCDLFICAGSVTEAQANCAIREKLTCDGQYHTLEVTLSDYAFWSGGFNKLRFDFFDVAEAGDIIYVRYIDLK